MDSSLFKKPLLTGWGRGSLGRVLVQRAEIPGLDLQHVIVVQVCNSSTQELEAGGSEVQGCLQLHSPFKVSLDYMRLCLLKKEKEETFIVLK